MTGVLIVARVGSTRLPAKHLIEAGGRSFIQWLAERWTNGLTHEAGMGDIKVIIATSSEVGNRVFEDLFSGTDTSVFYGADENIPLRQLQCARHYGLDRIVSVDGDDILCSWGAGSAVLNGLLSGEDFVTSSGLPIGMNVMGYTTSFLEASVSGFGEGKLETGWGRIFNSGNPIKINFEEIHPNAELRFTLDYPEDAAFFKAVIEGLQDRIWTASDKEIIEFVVDNKLNDINRHLSEEYMLNFIRQQKSE